MGAVEVSDVVESILTISGVCGVVCADVLGIIVLIKMLQVLYRTVRDQ